MVIALVAKVLVEQDVVEVVEIVIAADPSWSIIAFGNYTHYMRKSGSQSSREGKKEREGGEHVCSLRRREAKRTYSSILFNVKRFLSANESNTLFPLFKPGISFDPSFF